MSRTWDQQRFTVSEVKVDWQGLMHFVIQEQKFVKISKNTSGKHMLIPKFNCANALMK